MYVCMYVCWTRHAVKLQQGPYYTATLLHQDHTPDGTLKQKRGQTLEVNAHEPTGLTIRCIGMMPSQVHSHTGLESVLPSRLGLGLLQGLDQVREQVLSTCLLVRWLSA